MLFRKKKEESKTTMFEDVRDYYPIGTVVSVKRTNKKLMIFGIIQSDQTVKNGKTFDYVTVPYPEGNMGLEYQFLINQSDIESVYFRGCEDQEREDFLGRLAKHKENNNL